MRHDESELVAIAARAVDSLLPQAAIQAACKEYAEHMCAFGESYANKLMDKKDARIAELEAALEKSNEAACMGAEIAAVFPVKFPGDWEAPTHSLLVKER